MPNNPTQAISEVREALSKIPAPDFPRPAWWAERTHDAWSQVNEGHAFRRRMVADCVPHHLAPLIAAMNPDNARAILEDHDRLTKRVAELEEALMATETATTIQGYAKAEQLRRAAISRSTT